MKCFFGYIRVSTVKQGMKGSSLQEQRSAIDAYAQRYGLVISEWFEEKETAAKRGRPVFTRMLSLLSTGRADGIIIHKIDRSARNLRDWADLGELIDRGVDVHFANESLDLNTRGGRLSADIQAVVAADFIRNLREEVKKGFRGRLKQGLYPLPAPLGYKDQGRGMPKIPDPVAAPLVSRAFELYASGRYNLHTLRDELDRLGLKSRRGGRLSVNGLSTVLNNEFYTGIIHIRRTGERYQGVHERLVRKSLFDNVQARLSGKIRNTGLRHDFLYRQTLRCVHCGYSIIPERQKGWVYYRCHSTACPRTCIREEEIQGQTQAALDLVRMTPEEYFEVADEFRLLTTTMVASREDVCQSLRLNLQKLDERLARLTDALIDNLIDRATYEDRKGRLIHERASLVEQITEMGGNSDPLLAQARTFLELLEALSTNKKIENPFEERDLLISATSNLFVDRKKLVVQWESPFELVANRQKLECGEPYRGAPRTFRKPRRRQGSQRIRTSPHVSLARSVYDSFLSQLRSSSPAKSLRP